MKNAQSKQQAAHHLSNSNHKLSDEAPMVITRLSGWIGSGGDRAPMAAWIIRTRVRTTG